MAGVYRYHHGVKEIGHNDDYVFVHAVHKYRDNKIFIHMEFIDIHGPGFRIGCIW